MLIATRALLGVAGATIAPSTLSLIRNMFLDPKQRTTAISIWIMSFSLGGAIGPLLGGVMLEYFWWGSVFLLSVPVMVLLLIVGPFLLPEYRDPNAGKLDLRRRSERALRRASPRRAPSSGARWASPSSEALASRSIAACSRRPWEPAFPPRWHVSRSRRSAARSRCRSNSRRSWRRRSSARRARHSCAALCSAP